MQKKKEEVPKDWRINKIIAELSECREDERNAQSSILEIISIVGTILGILFGSTLFNTESINTPIWREISVKSGKNVVITEFLQVIQRNLTYARIVFLLSLLIFCAAFTYIIALGITNILRYYHIQNLQDRLYVLSGHSKDDEGRGKFLYWNEYIAPITTQNIKHISSTHTALHFTCYISAVTCVILFSIGLLAVLFLQISPKTQVDYLIIIMVVCGMVITFMLFFRLNLKAFQVSQFAWDVAHENQELRLEKQEKEIYKKAKSFRRVFMYMLYPKRSALQKPLLIFGGFICGVLIGDIKVGFLSFVNLLLFWFVFDFCAYQARYQINDMRGLDEDEEAGRGDRVLFKEINNPGHVLKISCIVLITRIFVALILTLLSTGQNSRVLGTGLMILMVITIFYEIAKTKQWKWGIFILVGIGYPLRFFMGFFSIVLINANVLSLQESICIIALLWFYGSMASIMAWVQEVTCHMKKNKEEYQKFPSAYKKKHYLAIQEKLQSYYEKSENDCTTEGVFPLREKGKLTDYWNIFFILSTVVSVCFSYLEWKSIPGVGMEIIALGILIFSIYLRGIYKKRMIWLGLIFFGGIAIYCITCGIGSVWNSVLLLVFQMLIVGTYFLLGYRPEMKDMRPVMKAKFDKGICILWGSKTVELWKKNENK